VLVAMSGGVDSSVAAALLRDAGHNVTGVTLKLWGGASDSGCCSVSDVEDARRVAAQLGIPHYVFDFTEDFNEHVVDPYVDAYSSARTPNPCVECNRAVKFGRLLDRALAMGFDKIATGHHARILETADGPALYRGTDPAKDQSYVLYMLGRPELERVLLPVGELTKAEVRAHAARLGLRTAAKPESMDVCFITRGDRARFLSQRSTPASGKIVDSSGAPLGEHDGLHRFTIGQRRGLGVAVGERRFVVDLDAETATVTVGGRDELLVDSVRVERASFSAEVPGPHDDLVAQVRAHGEPISGQWSGEAFVYAEPGPKVAPGQVVALYRGAQLIGGGIAA
jgi:tRNA-specific 2-thiouridylase